jgi:hypothetical protein
VKVTRQPHQRDDVPTQWFDIEDESGKGQFTARRTSDGQMSCWVVQWAPSPEVLTQIEEQMPEVKSGG